MMVSLFKYILHLADNSMMLGQRNSEWTGHGPVLEQDIAVTNISLDLLGQARYLYQHAASLFNNFTEEERKMVDKEIPAPWKLFNRELREDDLAFLRNEKQYLNVLLNELPKGDWAFTVLRQFFFSAYQLYLFEFLIKSDDQQLAAIAEKSLKEVLYHIRWSAEWVIRLGQGTQESNRRINKALEDMWMYTGEFFKAADYEADILEINSASAANTLRLHWEAKIGSVFEMAGLAIPKDGWMQNGGKMGTHSEHLGYVLSEMQYLQRTFPNLTW
ncbi:MAG: phenylacetate-CoA oxygenase subunit PaaC [Flavisolibacter sp.]